MSILRSEPEAQEIARRENLTIIRAEGLHQLLLDLDGAERWRAEDPERCGLQRFREAVRSQMKWFLEARGFGRVLHNACPVPSGIAPQGRIRSWPSKSNRGMHVVVDLIKPCENLQEALLLQGWLGSDPARDRYQLEHWMRDRVDARMLFQPAGALVVEGVEEVVRMAAAVELQGAILGEDAGISIL